jgi:hypothetical protein
MKEDKKRMTTVLMNGKKTVTSRGGSHDEENWHCRMAGIEDVFIEL